MLFRWQIFFFLIISGIMSGSVSCFLYVHYFRKLMWYDCFVFFVFFMVKGTNLFHY